MNDDDARQSHDCRYRRWSLVAAVGHASAVSFGFVLRTPSESCLMLLQVPTIGDKFFFFLSSECLVTA